MTAERGPSNAVNNILREVTPTNLRGYGLPSSSQRKSAEREGWSETGCKASGGADSDGYNTTVPSRSSTIALRNRSS